MLRRLLDRIIHWRQRSAPSTVPEANDKAERPLSVTHENGERIVSYQLKLQDGTLNVRHNFPDALVHHYSPSDLGEDVPLFAGEFHLEGYADPFQGDVRWRWGSIPRIEARGTKEARLSDVAELFAPDKAGDLWVSRPQIVMDLPDGSLPPQPTSLAAADDKGHRVVAQIEEQVGQGTDLTQVRFLVPNGWVAHDATAICEPDQRDVTWHARTSASGDGWQVILDMCRPMAGLEPWRELKDTYGQRFTHIGAIAREDGSTFTGEEAFDALDRLRLGLSLALGRRVTCALPVGYRNGGAVWTRWRSAPVQPYRVVSHFLDETIAGQQMSDIIRLTLDATADGGALAAVRSAVAYYTTANNDVTVDLTVPLPVTGLQLMAYYRFVGSPQAVYSSTQWRKRFKTTEAQLRHLLDDADIDLSIPRHLKNLDAARGQLSKDKQSGDALTTIVEMRNVATHPTRDLPFDKFDIYMWAEAGMLARYWLGLAILRQLGYDGKVAAVLGDRPRYTGQIKDVPWL